MKRCRLGLFKQVSETELAHEEPAAWQEPSMEIDRVVVITFTDQGQVRPYFLHRHSAHEVCGTAHCFFFSFLD